MMLRNPSRIINAESRMVTMRTVLQVHEVSIGISDRAHSRAAASTFPAMYMNAALVKVQQVARLSCDMPLRYTR